MADEGARSKTSTFSIQMNAESGQGHQRIRPSSAHPAIARPPNAHQASVRPASACPSDKKNQQILHHGSTALKSSKSGLMSYESLLVAQYLEELRRQKSEIRTEREVLPSPYLQRLPHSNLYPGKLLRNARYHGRHRPFSASMASSSQRNSRPKIDAKFIADATLWDAATPREAQSQRRIRPESAPVRKKRPFSGNSVSFSRHNQGPPRQARSIFKRQPRIIKVCAYKNGTRDSFVHISAPNLKILLEAVTEKLGLGFAARRIFLEDGIEVFDGADIPPHADVYISIGEDYKDPFGYVKRNLILGQGAKWSLRGIVLPEDRKKAHKHKVPKRLSNLAQKNIMRIIIYENGKGAVPYEVVIEPQKFDEFLQASTARLELSKFAKRAFDWEGNEVTDLEKIPELDDCLQNKNGQMWGPLWISTGEGFSPSGSHEYLLSLKQQAHQKLKHVQFYKKELSDALDEERAAFVTMPQVRSMSPDELYSVLEEAETDMENLKEKIKKLDEKLKCIKEKADKEETVGPAYLMDHIKVVDVEDRIVGHKGLRLKVFDNGLNEGEFIYYFNLRKAIRGVGGKEHLLQRLLDELSHTRQAANCPQPRLNAVAQHIFNKFGQEITDVMTLKYDNEVWVSYGEPFISPFTYCLEVIYEKASRAMSSTGTQHILRESMADPDILVLTKDHSKWEVSDGFPVSYDEGGGALRSEQTECDAQREQREIDSRATYMSLKGDGTVVLYPEIAMNEKPRRGHAESHLWIISKNGYIYNRGMPHLCLGVSDARIEGCIFGRDTPVEGFMVTLQKKVPVNSNQIWRFTSSGNISVESYPQLLLTYLGNKHGDDETYNENKPKNVLPGARVYLILSEPLAKKHAIYQRFALKQERFDNLGQWKHTDVANPEWSKQALSWPVKQDGELNEAYDWPMEGFLQAYAPPLLVSSKKGSGFTVVPKRLLVVKNGEGPGAESVPVIGPNLTSFLDNCTMMLKLPSAARRLFDENGEEHFSLQRLKRDQLVFVSCGDGWRDPKLTKEEQERRILLSQLASDVGKIRQYCALRNPKGFVLEVEGALEPGARMILGMQCVPSQQADTECSLPIMPEQQEDVDTSGMTAHERTHLLMEQRQEALRWPWEHVVNISTSVDASDMEAHKYSDPQMYEKFKPKPTARAPCDQLQRFVYQDGFIACLANRNLVLAASVLEGGGSEVVLAKKAPDDITQRWLILDNGEIRSRYKQKQVLTVSFPTDLEGRTESCTYSLAGCTVILQNQRANQFGHAHQRWNYNAETGFISAFNTTLPDKEITAANMSDVCTFSVTGRVEIDQPGYKAEIARGKGTKETMLVCFSCARTMRGRYRLEALPPSTPFTCAMGDAKKHKLPLNGSFRLLNSKVDLSTHEADITLRHWEDKLEALRQQTALNIHKNINAAHTVTTVKVNAYKNGEGRMRAGEIICGSTIEGILNQCTVRLGLNNSARRLYAEDGTILLDVEDIVDYAVNQYKNALADKLDAILQGEDQLTTEDNRDEEKRVKSDSRQDDVTMSLALGNVHFFGDSGDDAVGEEGTDAETETGNVLFPDGEREAEEEQTKTVHRPAEDGSGDTVETDKIIRRREALLSKVKLPALDSILRYPIEAWVSSGQSFIPPEVVESKEENRRKKRALQAKVCLELDLEKHCLRQMKGRRFKDQSPGVYRPTLSETQPVVLEGHWHEATAAEQDKRQSVDRLQTHLVEIQANQKREKNQMVGVDLTGALYKQPVHRRALVYCNGDNPEHAVLVWGDSLAELLRNATLKLGLWKNAKYFYTEDGKGVETLDDIKPEQLLCVSTGKPFIKPQSVHTAVEIRANWGRARKQFGSQATDIVVSAHKNPKVNVDPFGPPELALPPLTDGQELKKEITV